MSLQAMVVLVGVGLIAGWLGTVAMKVGGLFYLLASASDTGWLAMIVGAFLGAALLLVVQRMFWQVRPVPSRSKR